jgi:hypothetical protein
LGNSSKKLILVPPGWSSIKTKSKKYIPVYLLCTDYQYFKGESKNGNKGSSNTSIELKQIIESAKQLGVEISETEALQWLSAMAVDSDAEISMDLDTGVFGHKVVMLDFSPSELARFREIGRLVEFKDQPGVVETALALSGSSAQSKIQTYPGDCDYF